MVAGLIDDIPTVAALIERIVSQARDIVRTRLDLLEIATAATLRDGPAVLLIGRALAEAGNAGGNTLFSLLGTESSLFVLTTDRSMIPGTR